MTGSWDRDLMVDVDRIRDWGAAAVLTLVESRELVALNVERLGDVVAQHGLTWFHAPIVDVSVPDAHFEEKWPSISVSLRAMLHRGLNVLVHCKGGLGRAGTIGARLLIEMGIEPSRAISLVRAARPGAIETPAQERYVLGMQPMTK